MKVNKINNHSSTATLTISRSERVSLWSQFLEINHRTDHIASSNELNLLLVQVSDWLHPQ